MSWESPEKKNRSVIIDPNESNKSSSEAKSKSPSLSPYNPPPLRLRGYFRRASDTQNKFKRVEPPRKKDLPKILSSRNGGQAEEKYHPENKSIRIQRWDISLTSEGKENVRPFIPLLDLTDDDPGSESTRHGSITLQIRRRLHRGQFLYSTQDDKKILGFIIKNKLHSNYVGVSLWKDMEKMELFSIDRPWQGIKEHFVKKILPHLAYPKYGLNEENIRRFDRSRNNDKVQCH